MIPVPKPVNKSRTNLAFLTDDYRASYVYTDMGLVYYYAYNERFRNTDFYTQNHYELPQTLVTKLYQPEDKFKSPDHFQKAQELKSLIEADPLADQWARESLDLMDNVRLIKQGDMVIIKAIIRDWGLEPDGTPLKNHQLQALALYIVLGYCFNFGQMRTGKTPPTIIYAYALKLKGLTNGDGVDTNIVVCPNSIKHVWLSEIGKFTNDVVMQVSDVIEGTKLKRKKLWKKDSWFKIVNYESVRASIEDIHESLEGKKYGLYLDEVHNIKNPSQQTGAIKSLIESKDNPPVTVIGLSGTPVANKPQDVVRPVQMIAPGCLGKSYDDFVKLYSSYTDDSQNIRQFRSGALEDIRYQLARLSVRALRVDVNMELGKIIQPQVVSMTKDQKKIHDDLRDTLRAELMSLTGDINTVRINSFLAQMMKLQQVTAGFIFDNKGYVHWLPDKSNPKISWLDMYLEAYLQDIEKIVIACKFVPMIEKLTERYSQYGSTCIYGKVKNYDRNERMLKFQKDPSCRVMVINAKTAEGLDLNPCQFMVFITKDFQPKTNWQMEDRITGYNQVGEASIMPIICEKSIDHNLEIILAKKQKWFDAVMGDEGKTTPEYIDGGLAITRDDLFTMLGG